MATDTNIHSYMHMYVDSLTVYEYFFMQFLLTRDLVTVSHAALDTSAMEQLHLDGHTCAQK